MKTIVRSSVMLATLVGFAILSGAGQTPGADTKAPASTGKFDLAVSYTYKSAKISTTTGHFSLNGISVDGAYWLPTKAQKVAIACDFNLESAKNIQPNVNLDQISLVIGPRFNLWQSKSNGLKANIYGEGMAGFVEAFNSVFPTIPATASAHSWAFQAGGGMNLPLSPKFGWRVAEADYIATKLPNNQDTYQGDLRISTGFTFHF